MSRGELYLAYVHSQTNPQTCTKCGANRSSRLPASQDFWMCDPLNPPSRHAPLGIEGWLVFSLWKFPDESADVTRSSRLTASPDFLMFDPLKPPKCLSGNLFGVYPFPDESAHVYQMWCHSDQPFDIFPWLLNLWPPNPPPPPMSRGELYLAYIHSQANPQTCTKCVANRSSRLTASKDFWMCDPLNPPPKCPLVSWGSIDLADIHSQMNLHMCAKFGVNRSSRLVAFPEFVLS